MILPRSADAVVVGGGVIGGSAAYHLAKAGLKVVLVEKAFIGAGTSAATFAWVGAHSKTPIHYHRFSLEGIRHCQRIAEELDVDIEFMQRGSLKFLGDKEYAEAQARMPQMQAEGYDLRLVTRDEVFAMEPYAGKTAGEKVAGATFCPADAEVNPLLLLRGYARRAAEHGAVFCRATEVTGVLTDNGRVRGVATNRGDIHAPVLVNAAGPKASAIGELAGVPIPMYVTRGQILVTERLPPILNYIHSGLRQSRSGNLMIGVTTEKVGFDKSNSYEGIQIIARRILGIMPILKDVRVLRAYAGTRPTPNDRRPIIDSASALEGFYTAVMHSGITLSALVGYLLSEWISSGQKPEVLEPYRLSRFDAS